MLARLLMVAVPVMLASDTNLEYFTGDVIEVARDDTGWTVKVKPWVASGGNPFMAVMTKGYVPTIPADGAPLIVAVFELKLRPVGNVPVKENVGAGHPPELRVKLAAVPSEKATEVGPVMTGIVVLISDL